MRGHNKSRDIIVANDVIDQFKRTSATTELEKDVATLRDYICSIEKKKKFRRISWSPAITSIVEGTLLLSIDRRVRNGTDVAPGRQFHDYIDFAVPLGDMDVIETDGKGHLNIKYKTMKLKGSTSKPKIASLRLKFDNQSCAENWCRIILDLVDHPEVWESEELVAKDQVVRRMNKLTEQCEKSALALRSKNMASTMEIIVNNYSKEAFLKIAAYSHARKTAWFAANFDRLMEEAESKERVARLELLAARKGRNHILGAIQLDQLYRKSFIFPMAQLSKHRYSAERAPLEMRCKEFLVSAVDHSLTLFGKRIASTQGLAMGHMLEGIFNIRKHLAFIKLRNHCKALINGQRLLTVLMKSHLLWVQQKELAAGSSALTRWRQSTHASQLQYQGSLNFLRNKIKKDTSGVMTKWNRWARRLCDVDKEAWFKILNVVEAINQNILSGAVTRLQTHARAAELAENYQVLHNLTLVNDVLEQTFDAAPMERACNAIVSALNRRLLKIKQATVARMKHDSAHMIMVDTSAQLGATRLQEFINRYLLKQLLIWSHKNENTAFNKTLPRRHLNVATKKLGAHRIAKALRVCLIRNALAPAFSNLEPPRTTIQIVNRRVIEEQIKSELIISKRKHNARMIEYGGHTLCNVMNKVLLNATAEAFDLMALLSLKRLKVDWDAEYKKSTQRRLDRHDGTTSYNVTHFNWTVLISIAENEDKCDDNERHIFDSLTPHHLPVKREDILGFLPFTHLTAKKRMHRAFRGSPSRRTLPIIYNLLEHIDIGGYDTNITTSDSSSVYSSEISSLFGDDMYFKTARQPSLNKRPSTSLVPPPAISHVVHIGNMQGVQAHDLDELPKPPLSNSLLVNNHMGRL